MVVVVAAAAAIVVVVAIVVCPFFVSVFVCPFWWVGNVSLLGMRVATNSVSDRVEKVLAQPVSEDYSSGTASSKIA